MTTRLTFSREHTYPSGAHTANVPIRIRPRNSQPFLERAILDTGAAISRFDKTILRKAGVNDTASGTPRKVRMADNQEYQGYVHSIEIEFLGQVMQVPAIFCDEWDRVPNLLGMEGFFEQMLAGVDHARRKFYFSF